LTAYLAVRASAAESGPIIPKAIIDKSPSAELRPNQKDEDSLPPYDTLDAILRLRLCENLSPNEIAAKGWDSELVNRIINTMTRMEFKRIQSPPSLAV
jgi:NH3-dependent NAD+ synthetase